jgi:hypothetical protein
MMFLERLAAKSYVEKRFVTPAEAGGCIHV